MIHFTLTGKQAKDFFGMISEFSPECRLHIEPDKIRVFMVDSANVAFLNSQIEVSTGTKESVEFGLQLSRILNFVKIAKDTDPVEFKIIKTKKSELRLRVSCLTHSAKIKSEDTNTVREDPNQVKLNLPTAFRVSGERIVDFFKMFTTRGGAFYVIAEDKKVILRTHNEFDYEYETVVGNATGSVNILF
jgi:hypothetical protein